MYKTSKKLDKSASFTCGLASKVLLAALLAGTMPVCAQPIITPTLGDNSLFNYTETSTSGDNTFNVYSYENGELTEKIYNITTKANYDTGRYGSVFDVDSIDGWFMNYDFEDYSYRDRSTWAIIYNRSGYIGEVNADFYNNKSDNDNLYRQIGVYITAYNASTSNRENYPYVGSIKGDFINNGLAISIDTGRVDNISGNFINNMRAIDITNNEEDNENPIGNIQGNFIKNHQGAIYFEGYPNSHIENINANFFENSISTANGTAYGGAIYSGCIIDNMSGLFVRNKAIGETYYGAGGAGGAISLGDWNSGTVEYFQEASLNINNSAFIENSAEGRVATGGAIYNASRAKISNTDFINNMTKAESGFSVGGAVATDSENFALPQTIASLIYKDMPDDSFSYIFTNSNFIGNTAETANANSLALGGAIYSEKNIKIAADGEQSLFSGNKTIVNGVENNNAIFMGVRVQYDYERDEDGNWIKVPVETFTPTAVLDTKNGGVIRFDDKIDGGAITLEEREIEEEYDGEIYTYREEVPVVDKSEKYNLGITGDSTGKVIFNNTVENANISIEDGANVQLTNETYWDNNNLTMAGGELSFVNNAIGVSSLNNLTVADNTNFVADVDLANKEMDRFTAAEYGEHTGNINVIGMNILSDAVEGESVTAVYFAEPDLKNNVVNAISGGTGDLPDSFQTTAYTPIYKYNVIYDKDNQYDGKGDGGYFVFAKGDIILPDEPDEPDEPNLPIPPTGGGTTGNPSDAFNPAVLATPVGNLAAGQAAMNEAFKYVFEHADAFTQLPSMERYAKINANKYALSTDFNENLPSYADQLHNNAVWFRPYTTFETMNIKNGPKVDAITYGSLVGFDGDFKEMKNGWSRIFTGYAGYMGSSLNYSGVDTTMNGGLLGFTETFYKGNFWTAITASAGASVGESHTMYGKEDYTSLLAGVGSKTGYNFEFKDGKFIIQPIMFLSYTFVNTFDYKNAAGVNIESDPLHTIQLNPSVRFIANLKGGWQPYASVGMVWNLMNESKVTANNVKLPEMSVKPYVEYGVGVQRNWADKFTAFLQAMIRNGGRNGIALTGGFRFMLGSDSKNSDKPKVKKEIKSL